MKKIKRIISLFVGLLMITMVPTKMEALSMDIFCVENCSKLLKYGLGLELLSGLGFFGIGK